MPHEEEPFRANSRMILSLSEPMAARGWIEIPEPELCHGQRPPLFVSSEMKCGLLYLSQRANLDCVHCVAVPRSDATCAGTRYVRTCDLNVDQKLSEQEQRCFVLRAAQLVSRQGALDEAFIQFDDIGHD